MNSDLFKKNIFCYSKGLIAVLRLFYKLPVTNIEKNFHFTA